VDRNRSRRTQVRLWEIASLAGLAGGGERVAGQEPHDGRHVLAAGAREPQLDLVTAIDLHTARSLLEGTRRTATASPSCWSGPNPSTEPAASRASGRLPAALPGQLRRTGTENAASITALGLL
jgi:hypothetical protein